MPTLSKIALAFARYTNLTLGGGSAAAATLYRELVEKRQCLTDDQFTLSLALGRVTPGTNLFAFCTGFGYLLRGLPGAIVAPLASSVPCAVFVTALSAVFAYWRANDIPHSWGGCCRGRHHSKDLRIRISRDVTVKSASF
jgi:chromate transporter